MKIPMNLVRPMAVLVSMLFLLVGCGDEPIEPTASLQEGPRQVLPDLFVSTMGRNSASSGEASEPSVEDALEQGRSAQGYPRHT